MRGQLRTIRQLFLINLLEFLCLIKAIFAAVNTVFGVMEADKIVVHAMLPYGGSISASPFPIRVEMFLRLAKIPHTVSKKSPFHSYTKKTPWVEYKG